MNTITPLSGRRAIAVAEAVTLVGFVLFIALQDLDWIARFSALLPGAAAVLLCGAVYLLRTRAHAVPVLVAAASTLGLVGAVVYLHSLADDPSAIPLGGVGGLLLSLVGMVVTAALLASGDYSVRAKA